MNEIEIIQQAKAISRVKRKEILMSFKETDLHKHLKALYEAMESNYYVEITHSAEELGKDLIIIKKDKISMDVIGVIVKTGDIRAKTLDRVDELKNQIKNAFSYKSEKKIEEIKSQVEQAMANPTMMKAVFKELQICRCFIVLAGELSRQARERLQNEVKQPVEYFDVEWLIDNFTQYYPQVFFEGEVIDFIQNKIVQLETKHWLHQKKINLSDYFVEPMVSNIELPIKFDAKSLDLIISKRPLPFSQLKTIAQQIKKIILVGDPGVGKSSALVKLALDMLRSATAQLYSGSIPKKKIMVPILIAAKEFLKFDNIRMLLETNLGTKEISDRFEVSVLMIDSLDEVIKVQGKEVLKKAVEFSEELSCSVIITSRKVDAIKSTPVGFEKYELMPFEFGQAIELLEKLVSSKESLIKLKDSLEKIRFQIPLVPLSLILLIQLVEEKKEIPASITELYDRFFDLMFGRWDREKGIEVLFEYFQKRSYLAELAYKEFFQKGRLEIKYEDYKDFFENYSKRYDVDFNALLKEIERAGVLMIKDSIHFQHRSFLDYFVARYLFDKRTEIKGLSDFLVQVYFDDIWSDVTFFYIGLMREINLKTIKKIFSYKQEELSALLSKFLAGRLLQAGWNSPADIKYYGIEEAIKYSPIIRSKFLEIMKRRDPHVPHIYADFLVLIFSEVAFGSLFLFKQAKAIFDNLSNIKNIDNLNKMLSILWAIRKFYEPDELKESINKFLDFLSKMPNITVEDEAKSLLFLEILEKEDKAFVKMMRKRIDKLKKKYKDTFKKLLPSHKKGFR